VATKVEKSVVVDVPIDTVYDQWTQFEEFPHFMDGIAEIRQLDDRTTHWVATIGGVRREWNATILEQIPNQKVAWAATEGATNAGAVYFSSAAPGQTTVRLELEYEPEGLIENVADKVGVVGRRAEADLEKFKSFIEDEGYATGAWRGTIPGAGGTPGVEAAAASRGDSGNAGVSAKTIVGAAAGAAAAAAGVAAAAKAKSDDAESESTPRTTETETVALEPDVAAVPPLTDPVAPADTVPGGSTYPAGTGTTDPLDPDVDRRA
jgi:uncharacterized protein YndB with AHSA1/START domain